MIRVLGRDFPGGPVVNTSPSSTGDTGSISGQGANIPHALNNNNNKNTIKQKQYCNEFNKDFKNGPCQRLLETSSVLIFGL